MEPMKKSLHTTYHIPHTINGYTLAEILVVVSIILILATAALQGTRSIIKNMRFSNAFNKMLFMVQHGRNLAITGKDSTAKNYGVRFEFIIQPHKAIVYKTIDKVVEDIDTFTLEKNSNLEFTVTPKCLANVMKLEFTNKSGEAKIICGNTPPQSTVTIGLKENAPDGRSKSFSIHAAGGIPQVE